jgi:hypothetical protein
MTGAGPLSRLLAHRLFPPLATILLTALGVMLVTWPLARAMDHATLRAGEVLLTAWQLNWFHQALRTDPAAWIDANIFFPYDRAATFNDLLMTHAVVTLPAAWAASPVLALNLALLGGIVLCGLFAYLLIDELVDEPWAAVAGGVLFALAPFRFLHLGHLAVAAAWAVPLFYWALLRHLRQPSWGWAALTATSGIAVGLSSLYQAAFVAPIAPFVLLAGVGRGPADRRVWLPLVVTGLPALAVLAWFLAPYAQAMDTFGVAAAPSDLLRYGADLSSLGLRPEMLEQDGARRGVDAEAHLYPGAALAVLGAIGALSAAALARSLTGWRHDVAVALLTLCGVGALGLLLPLQGPFRKAWELALLALIWAGPLAVMAWTIAAASTVDARGAAGAIRVGIAGAALAFVLALGPQARYLARVIGPAPYWLLAQASSAFEGTRVPARFGGLVMLFLAIVAAGALASAIRARARSLRVTGAGATVAAILVCFLELPLPALPKGHDLVGLPQLEDPVYRWIAERPGRFGILELPDWPSESSVEYWHREWRALRHMLASKQHGQHLVNGSGRIEPFLWHRFRQLEPWSDDFFAYIAAYFPVDYVVLHEGGIPDGVREALMSRLARGTDGWLPLFRSPAVRLFALDRSFGRGAALDRLFLRRSLAPRADVVFTARVAGTPGAQAGGDGRTSLTLELLRDGEPIGTWPLDTAWREFRVSVAVTAVSTERSRDWPRTGTLLRWRLRDEPGGVFEIRDLSVERSQPPLD